MTGASSHHSTKIRIHIGEAYENLLISERGSGVWATIANAQELSDNKDDSITTITDVMRTMQMASNANS